MLFPKTYPVILRLVKVKPIRFDGERIQTL